MKSAGIITYWCGDYNYGTILQNYAVQTILKENNIEGELIRYNIYQDKTNRNKTLIYYKKYGLLKTIIRILFKVLTYFFQKRINKKNKNRNFNSFVNMYIKHSTSVYKTANEISQNYPQKDLYIAGSDQIWNVSSLISDYARKEIPIAFLLFAPKNSIKMSFAASFGKDNFSSFMENDIKKALKDFSFISVREPSGIDICKKLGYENAVYHIDPTLLLTKEQYQKLYTKEKNKKKYILLYLLNDKTEFDIQKFYKWAKLENLDVIYVNGNTNNFSFTLRKITYPSIPQWLKLIDEAEYVFTNSYHGCIFSILFNKEFYYINQKKYISKPNIRITSLFDTLNIQDRVFKGDYKSIKKNKINYDIINSFLDEYRKNSSIIKFIKTIGIK